MKTNGTEKITWLDQLLSKRSIEERYLEQLINLTGILFEEARKKYPKAPTTYEQLLGWCEEVNPLMTKMLRDAWHVILNAEAFQPYIEIDYPHYFITAMPRRPMYRALSLVISALLNEGENAPIQYPERDK